ncbi:MAG TPA: PP2C family protein-serine/threonine phosphatase [Acidimicrobiales bacterium]|nr:PP2C family protein-serine/threonine phosphatase [Acidimicrobiales bacterium]
MADVPFLSDGTAEGLGWALRALEGVLAVACLVSVTLWGRSARRLKRALGRIERTLQRSGGDDEAADLSRAAFRKEMHTTLLYAVLALALGAGAIGGARWTAIPLALCAVPLAMSIGYGRNFVYEAELAESRSMLLRRAEEVMEQADLAPRRWAQRLAPSELPSVEGFEIGTVYEPGTGSMAGDFYDLYRTAPNRLAAVIGDVAGHGIEPSITAFQVKYLLRAFLERYRDPAQAVEELNKVMFASGQPDELVSLCVVVFDLQASTLRVCSAGHPPAWLWHEGEVRPLRSSGPLLTLDPNGTFTSREVSLDKGDLLLLYTDGLTEARKGEVLFGEERVAATLRREPGRDPAYLCKALLEAARDFSGTALGDDVAILAIKRT